MCSHIESNVRFLMVVMLVGQLPDVKGGTRAEVGLEGQSALGHVLVSTP